MRKYWWVFFIGGILLFLGLLVLSILRLNQANSVFKRVYPKISYNFTDYSDVRNQTITWLNDRKVDNWYVLELLCDPKEKTCNKAFTNSEGNRDGLLVTYALYRTYLETKNSVFLDNIKNDVNSYYGKYANSNNEGIWLCKISYDLFKSNLFDKETNNKLKQICWDKKFTAIDELKKYWDNRATVFSKLDLSGDEWNNWAAYSAFGRGFDSTLSYVSDLLTMYEWKKDSKLFELANEYLAFNKEILESGKINSQSDVCLVGTSALDMYKYEEKTDNLDYAEWVYKTYLSDRQYKTYRTPVCELFIKDLLLATNKELYFSRLESDLKTLTSIFVDGKSNNITNDGSFYKMNIGSLSSPVKNVTENAMMVSLLSD